MSPTASPAAWGVASSYRHGGGRRRRAPAATVQAILGALGAAGPAPPVRTGGPLLVRPGDGAALGRGTLCAEDGGEVATGPGGPAQLPLGYHRWLPAGGSADVALIVSPGSCPPVQDRQWGLAAQLYAARSRSSWGIGDLGDLRELGRRAAELGAGFVLVNPLHAGAPRPPRSPSPYSPSSRSFLDPLSLRIDQLPEAAGLSETVTRAAAAGRALDRDAHLDRDRVWALKAPVLEACFERFRGSADFDRFRRERGEALSGFCLFNALAERHGLPWQSWPPEVRHPAAPGAARFQHSPQGRRRMRFHAWLQWQLDRQLAAAAATTELILDLAVGVDPGGADAWWWQDTFAPGMSVGAPPDEFNAAGQDWGLAPWDPWKLRGIAYRPFVETVRAGLRHGAGLRVDHVMGLFRLFWIPEGRPPGEGTYVAYPSGDLLDILALEAERAGALVVGEDLGTVPRGVRAELARRRVLSYRLLWFEPSPPGAWPAGALGAVTTHDLPTVAGVWTGADLAEQQRLGLPVDEEGMGRLRGRLRGWAGVADNATVTDAVAGAYRALAGAPCARLAVTLEDLCEVVSRPNLPGTTTERANWSTGLPVPIEQLGRRPLSREIAGLLGAAVRQPGGADERGGGGGPA